MEKVVFFDRDGTLLRTPEDRRVDSVAKVVLFPDTVQALRLLVRHGYAGVVITNQTGIAEGRFTPEEYARISQRLLELLQPSAMHILKIYTCPHSRADGCACRKPKPTMVLDATKEFGIDPTSAYLIGDRQDDMDLGKNAGIQTVLVETGPFRVAEQPGVMRAKTLLEAAECVVRRDGVGTAIGSR